MDDDSKNERIFMGVMTGLLVLAFVGIFCLLLQQEHNRNDRFNFCIKNHSVDECAYLLKN